VSFLELCIEKQVLLMMDGKRYRHVEIFQLLVSEMEQRDDKNCRNDVGTSLLFVFYSKISDVQMLVARYYTLFDVYFVRTLLLLFARSIHSVWCKRVLRKIATIVFSVTKPLPSRLRTDLVTLLPLRGCYTDGRI